MTAPELKPCPFCGECGTYGGRNDHGGFTSVCANCGAAGPPVAEMSKDDILTAWNTRTATDRLIAEAVAAERERCAKIADDEFGGRICAAKIRGEWVP